MTRDTLAQAQGGGEVVVEVLKTRCGCHPETCCCGDYTLWLNGKAVAKGFRDKMQAIADAINAKPAPPSAPVEVECPNCGSKSLTWEPCYTSTSGVPDGRLRVHEVRCVFALGCDDCSETVRVVSADEAALALAQPQGGA